MEKIILCTSDVNIDQVLRGQNLCRPGESVTTAVCTSNMALAAALDQSARRRAGRPDSFFSIKTNQGSCLCPLGDVVICRADGHRLTLHLEDGTHLVSRNTRCSFAVSAAAFLADSRFLSCSRAVVVNIGYIQRVEENRILFYDGSSVPLSVRWRSTIRARLLSHQLQDGQTAD